MKTKIKRAPWPKMNMKDIQKWLHYWDTMKMVSVDQITAFDQVYQARKYCSCMRVGVMEDVSDLSIWNALVDIRIPKKAGF